MFDVSAMVGAFGGIFGSVMALGSVVYQRRQTQIMEAGLERAANEDPDAPEVETGTVMEKQLRMVLNKRLSENRAKMRQEFGARIDQVERKLDEYHNSIRIYENALPTLMRYLNDQKDITEIADEAKGIRAEVITAHQRIQAETGRYSDDIAAHGREIEALQRQLEDIRTGNIPPDTIRAQLRAVAQQLLEMTSQGQDLTY